MKRFGVLMASAALCGALVLSGPAEAYRGFRGAGWHGGGWHGGGWRGGRWGWAGNRWAGNRWGWNRGWGGGGWGLGTGLGLAAAASPWWGGNYANYGYGNYPYYGYGSGYPYGYSAATAAPVCAAAATTAPLVTGRSVATGQVEMGNYCTTPARTCLLYNESWVGNGCSCRVPGGRARGSVTP